MPSLTTQDAGGYDCPSVPGIEAEDAVGLCDGVPALDVAESGTVGDARLHMLGIKFCLRLLTFVSVNAIT
jgi:hypothetical protein